MTSGNSTAKHFHVIKYDFARHRERFFFSEAMYTTWFLLAVEEGAFAYEIGGSTGTAVIGDIVLCPPQVLFRREVINKLTFHLFEFEASSPYGEELLQTSHTQTVRITIHDLDRLRTTFQFLHRLAQEMTPIADFFRSDLLTDMLQQHKMESIVPEFKLAKHEDPVISEVVKLIDRNLEAQIQFQHIARDLQMSQATFTARFHKVVGVTPVQYLTSVRLKKARALLLETEMTIDEISMRCGYQNGFYLSRIFTKYMGVTPSTYRRTNRV